MAYFPNGSSGYIIDAQCAECVIGRERCPIYLVQCEYNYKQVNNPDLRAAMNMLVDADGKCQMLAAIDEYTVMNQAEIERRRDKRECPHCLGKNAQCIACGGAGVIDYGVKE